MLVHLFKKICPLLVLVGVEEVVVFEVVAFNVVEIALDVVLAVEDVVLTVVFKVVEAGFVVVLRVDVVGLVVAQFSVAATPKMAIAETRTVEKCMFVVMNGVKGRNV